MKILSSIKQNDMRNLSFLYSLKAVFIVALCAFLGYKFDYLQGEILAIIGATSIYFLPITCTRTKAFFMFFVYILVSLSLLFCLNFIQKFDFWIWGVFIFWFFFVSILIFINKNLTTIFKQATFIAILAFVLNTQPNLEKSLICFGVALFVALIFRFISFSPYGRFSRKIFSDIIMDLSQLALNLDSLNFNILQEKLSQKLQNLNQLFNSPSINTNDQFIIKNQAIALFYLHKCEEIFDIIISLKIYFQDGDFKPIQNEISKNIKLIKNIFSHKNISFALNAYKILKKTNNSPILLSLLDVLYDKLDIFIKVSKKQIKLEFCDNTALITKIKNAFKTKNLALMHILKFSLIGAIGAIISLKFGLDLGLYFIIGAIIMLEISFNCPKCSIKNGVFGAIFGAIIGNIFAFQIFFTFNNYLILHIAFGIGVFLILYLKIFKPFAWICVFMGSFSFYLATQNTLNLQIALYFGAIFGMILWQKDTKNLYTDKLNLILDDLSNITNSLLEPNLNEFKTKFSLNLQVYKNSIKHPKFGAYNAIIGDLQILYSLIIDLENFIHKNNFDTAFLKNDLRIISKQFTIIKNINLALPVYFCSENLFMLKDDKLLWMMSKITQIQRNLAQKLI